MFTGSSLLEILKPESSDIGNLRETFLVNQLADAGTIAFSQTGDFLVDGKYTIEVGGRNKTRRQIQDTPDSFVAADNLEYGNDRKIPLWLFGFLS